MALPSQAVAKGNAYCLRLLLAGLVSGASAAIASPEMAFYPAAKPGAAQWSGTAGEMQVENGALKQAWSFGNGIRLKSVANRYDGKTVTLDLPLFVLHYRVDGEARTMDSADCPASKPWNSTRKGNPSASRFSDRLPGQQAILQMENEELSVKIVIDAGTDANYVRQILEFSAKRNIEIDRLDFFPGLGKEWSLAGEVRGVPFVLDGFFLSGEHPSCTRNKERNGHQLDVGFSLKKGNSWSESSVVGVVPSGQLRRGFLHYVERERASPFHVFPHYNNWMVTCFASHPYDEDTVRRTIENWGENMIEPYGVKIDSFALDDGWDDCHNSMWEFHPDRFPNGFKPFKPLLKKYDTSLGIWLSPAGGYQEEGKARLAYAGKHGLLNGDGELSLAFPPYYDLFSKRIADILVEQNVNYFKIDRLGGVEELNAAKRLFGELRSIRPNIFINLTRDSWPSPFWLRIADSLWRGGWDTKFADVPGSKTRQWIAYRDGIVRQNVVKKSPLYPISSLMVHGLILARLGRVNQFMDGDMEDFYDQAQSFVCSGINCEELYIDYTLMTEERWAFLAQLLKWARANQHIFADVHWVGGDPFKAEVYGWAAWTPEKMILTLRNPSDKTVAYRFSPRTVFELPVSEKGTLTMKKLWSRDNLNEAFECDTDGTIKLELAPLQTVTWEGALLPTSKNIVEKTDAD